MRQRNFILKVGTTSSDIALTKDKKSGGKSWPERGKEMQFCNSGSVCTPGSSIVGAVVSDGEAASMDLCLHTRKEKTEFVFIRNYIGQSLP